MSDEETALGMEMEPRRGEPIRAFRFRFPFLEPLEGHSSILGASLPTRIPLTLEEAREQAAEMALFIQNASTLRLAKREMMKLLEYEASLFCSITENTATNGAYFVVNMIPG